MSAVSAANPFGNSVQSKYYQYKSTHKTRINGINALS